MTTVFFCLKGLIIIFSKFNQRRTAKFEESNNPKLRNSGVSFCHKAKTNFTLDMLTYVDKFFLLKKGTLFFLTKRDCAWQK